MRAFRTLQDIADAFSETPERRKTLVYVSPGVTVNFSDANSPVLASGTGRGMASHVAAQSLASGVAALMHEFERNNVTVYAVDPAGSAGLEAYIAPRLRNIPALTYAKMAPVDDAGHVPLGTVPLVDSLAHFEGNLGRDFLQITADSTGGHAFINTSDFEGALSQILRETSSYYWIGYAATDPGSGKMHRLSVKVDRPGVEVRTRNIYYASDAKAAAKEAKASPVSTAMAGVLPRAEVPLGVVLAPFAAPGPTGATVAIVLGVTQPAPPAETTSQVDLLTRAYTADGQFRGVHAQTAEVTIRPGGPNDVARYEVLSRIDLKPGRYQLRLAAHSTTDARTGSVFADVEVPDFAKALVSLSGVLFEATPSIADAPRDALVGIVPIVPTAERGFDRSAKANAFVRVYQGGTAALAPIALAIRIVDATGVARLDRHETIAASSFDAKTRSVDERVALPLATLPAGDLLLTVEVRLSQTAAERQVRFTVR
jgi:hypothetical protein